MNSALTCVRVVNRYSDSASVLLNIPLMRHLYAVFAMLIALSVPLSVAAVPDQRIESIQMFLEQGNFRLAINTAQSLLQTGHLSKNNRFQLLGILARAEELRAQFRGYARVDTAVHAYQSLQKEFPQRVNSANVLWHIAQLHWHNLNSGKAETTIQKLLRNHPRSPEAVKASLLLARILIKKGKYAKARGLLLANYGLGDKNSPKQEAEGLAWLAMVDRAEGRDKQAFKTMKKSFDMQPEAIKKNGSLYAAYIHLLAEHQHRNAALRHAQQYVKHFIADPEAPNIRLLQADILEQQKHHKQALDIYGVLADRYFDIAVGKIAHVRLLLLQHRGVKDSKRLMAALKVLQRLAAENQMSDVESEAQMNEARILARLAGLKVSEQKKEKKQDEAIGIYALVAASDHPRFVLVAKKEGRVLFNRRVKDMLKKQQWLAAVVLWKRYPQLRPTHANQLAFGIALAYIQLLDFDHAQAIFDRLSAQAGNSLWGQRIMVEQAHLWREREDPQGISKIMRWLTQHEDTLYRQDFLLIVAQMQVKKKRFSSARQTLTSVQTEDLLPDALLAYWQTTAKINTGLQRWHSAANAWGRVVRLKKKADRWPYMRIQAQALIHGEDSTAAEHVLLGVPEKSRDNAWKFTMAQAMQKLKRLNEAAEYLQALATANPPNAYSMRARVLLVEQRAERLGIVNK